MCSLRQTLGSFGKDKFSSWDLQFFIFQTIPSISKFMTSWHRQAHEVEHIFNFFWILRPLDMNLDQLIDIIINNTFRKGFPWFKVLDLTSKLMFVKSCTNIWQNLIFILPKIVKNQSKVYLQTSINIYDDVKDFEVWAFTENRKT